MNNQYSIFVVILHYGKTEMTQRLHNQLVRSDPDLKEKILVLDNHAPEQYPQAWVRLLRNCYWGGALQWTMKKFQGSGCTHVWFLNNDIMFDCKPPIVGRALQRLAWIEKNAGPVGIYSPSALTNPYHQQMISNRKYQYRIVQYIDGIAPMINLQCWSELEDLGIEENLIGYGVDNYFSLQAREKGWNVVVDHQVTIKHDYHSTARRIKGFMKKAAQKKGVYLEKRLGSDYSRILNKKSLEYTDY
ncbi:MAG: glycosyltransferase family 2 protein [Desulfonatronovibrio sp.]